MKYLIKILCVAVFLSSCQNNSSKMNIVFTGDVLLDRGVKDQIKLYGDSLLVHALGKISDKDFLIINYEGTFTSSYNHQNDIFNFKTSASKSEVLQEGGVTHVSVANNHSFDFNEPGFRDTVEALKKNSLKVIGETCFPKILKKDEYECGVLAVSLTSNNESFCISSIDQLKSSVKEFNILKPETPLIVYIHWGLELQPKPEVWQRNLSQDLVNLGVDAIIGHHPHVVQSIEFIDEVPIFYSLGNYIADAYLTETDKSYIVEMEVTDNIQSTKIKPVKIKNYFPEIVKRDKQFLYIKDYLSYSNGICAIQSKDGWVIKSTEDVDFSEKTNLWVFSAEQKIITVKKLKTGTHVFMLYTSEGIASNPIRLHGKLSEIAFSDINNDGAMDVLLGISKKVNFDPVEKKRINIYSYQNQSLQPLWLGTKFINDIENFATYNIQDFNYLTTVEINEQGKRHDRMYEWDDFGFALTTMNQIKTNEN